MTTDTPGPGNFARVKSGYDPRQVDAYITNMLAEHKIAFDRLTWANDEISRLQKDREQYMVSVEALGTAYARAQEEANRIIARAEAKASLAITQAADEAKAKYEEMYLAQTEPLEQEIAALDLQIAAKKEEQEHLVQATAIALDTLHNLINRLNNALNLPITPTTTASPYDRPAETSVETPVPQNDLPEAQATLDKESDLPTSEHQNDQPAPSDLPSSDGVSLRMLDDNPPPRYDEDDQPTVAIPLYPPDH